MLEFSSRPILYFGKGITSAEGSSKHMCTLIIFINWVADATIKCGLLSGINGNFITGLLVVFAYRLAGLIAY